MEPRLAPELEEALAVLIGQMPGAAPPLSARDLADAVWLASVVPSARPELKDDPTKISPPSVNPEDQKTTPDSTTPTAEKAAGSLPPAPGPPAPTSDQKLLYPKPPAGDLPPYAVPATELLSPTARAVPGLRSLAGALRPLMRKVPQPGTFRLDEDATVEKWSELLLAREPGCFPLWPVLKPGLMREWEIVLLVDRAPGMRVWSGVAEELSALLQWQGAFRGVHLWEMETTGTEPLPPLTPRAGGAPRAPTELLSARGDRLIVALTDGMAPAWTEGRALDLLGELGRRGPVAVWQVLPEHLWRLTGFGTPGWDVTPLAPGTSNSGLAARRRTEEWDTPEASTADAELLRKTVPLPLVSLTPAAMGRWARLVMGLGHSSLPAIRVAPRVPLRGYRGLRPEAAAAAAVAKPEPVVAPDPERLLAEFRTQITPMARRLAGLLAYVPLTIPIMRVVQQAMLPTSNQGHLAEFLMSGLAYPVDGERFEFYPGIRERLVRTVTLRSTLEVQEAVGRRLGLPPETVRRFAAYAVDANAAPAETDLSPDQLPFAKLAAEALRELRLVKPAPSAAEMEEPPAPEPGTANLQAPSGFRLRSEAHLDLGKLSLVTWVRDGWLVVGAADGEVHLWQARDALGMFGEVIRLLGLDGRPVQVLGEAGPAGVHVVTTSGSLFCLNPVTGQPNYQLLSLLNSSESSASDTPEIIPGAGQPMWRLIHVPNPITCAALTPTGWLLATGDAEGLLSLRDAHSGHMVTPQSEPAAIRALAWSPDRKVLAAASDHDFTVTLWSITLSSGSATLVRRLRGHTTTIRHLVWSPDGAQLISADADGVIGIWNTSNLPSVDEDEGGEVLTFPQDLSAQIIRCPAGVSAPSFSPDGRILAASGEDGRVRLWRTDSWQVVGGLSGSPGVPGTSTMAFHPQEPLLAVLAENGETVRLWDVDVEMLLASATTSAAPDLVSDPDVNALEERQAAAGALLQLFDSRIAQLQEAAAPAAAESGEPAAALDQPGDDLPEEPVSQKPSFSLSRDDLELVRDILASLPHWRDADSRRDLLRYLLYDLPTSGAIISNNIDLEGAPLRAAEATVAELLRAGEVRPGVAPLEVFLESLMIEVTDVTAQADLQRILRRMYGDNSKQGLPADPERSLLLDRDLERMFASIDRQSQVDEFRIHYIHSDPSRPIFFIIPGTPDDLPEQLVQRLIQHELPRLEDNSRVGTPHTETLPSVVTIKLELDRFLSPSGSTKPLDPYLLRQFDAGTSNDHKEFDARNRIVAVIVNFNDKDTYLDDRFTSEFIQSLTRSCKNILDREQYRRLLVFAIAYSGPSLTRHFAARITKEIRSCLMGSGENITTLSTLPRIDRHDVEAWLRSTISYENPLPESFYASLVDLVFADRIELSMKEVQAPLSRHLPGILEVIRSNSREAY